MRSGGGGAFRGNISRWNEKGRHARMMTRLKEWGRERSFKSSEKGEITLEKGRKIRRAPASRS